MQVMQSNKSVINSLIFTFILLNTIVIYYYNSKNIHLKIAYHGWGPQHYVYQKIAPDNYAKNWDSGIFAYDNSLIMRVFYWSSKYLDIRPDDAIYPFMFIQTFVFLISIYFLSFTLFEKTAVSLLTILIIPLTSLAGANLARFGEGFGWYLSVPLFYGYANSFRIIAFTFFIKNKFSFAFIFLALSIYCHVTMGFFILAIILGISFLDRKILTKKQFLIWALFFGVAVAPYLVFILSNSNTPLEIIPSEAWIKSTRIFSVHWYPITMKLFSKNASLEFVPIILSCALYFISIKSIEINDHKHIKILLSSLLCILMSIIGIILSDIFPIPFVIKLSLQRSTELLTFFNVLYLINYLYEKLNDHRTSLNIVASFSIIALIFTRSGISLLPLIYFVYQDIKSGIIGPWEINKSNKKRLLIFFYVFLIFMLLISLMIELNNYFAPIKYLVTMFWEPILDFSFFRKNSFILMGGGLKFSILTLMVFCIITTILFFLNSKQRLMINTKTTLFYISCSLVGIILISYAWRSKYHVWHDNNYPISKSYMEVQFWAANNTPQFALFQTDPSHYYGWRDYSRRSSFGNVREWGYTSIAYIADENIYRQGIERMAAFGIDLNDINNAEIRKKGSFKYKDLITNIAEKKYYEMSNHERSTLFQKYDIDYFVMLKSKLKLDLMKQIESRFLTVFENKHYIVYSCN